MDSFETVIGKLLEHEGFWVRTSFKVKLTEEDRKIIERHSSPRWEIDLVAYDQKENVIWMVECKSYLDSGGVNISAFNGKNPKFASRFKLFTEDGLFPVIKNRLCAMLLEKGACRRDPTVRLLLVAGNIAESSRAELKQHFLKNQWELWDEEEIRKRLIKLADDSYDDTVVSVVSKILLRGKE